MKFFSSLFLSTVIASTLFGAKIIDRTIVTVNDEVILESDIDKFMDRMKSKSFQELFGGTDNRASKDREVALQLLIEERIINQQVKKLELTVTDLEVEGQIKAICKRNGISKAQLEERLKQLGTPFSEYKDGIRKQIERKNLIDREIKPNTEITEEQLRHYYMRTAKGDDQLGEFKIAHILFVKKPSGPSPLERAKTVAEEIKKNSSDFAKLAKEYSDDSSTAESEGVLGFFPVSSLSKEFREVVPKTPVGQVTAPIKTSAGIHLVKVLEARSADMASIPRERREAVKNQMAQEEVEKKMGLWLERKKAEAHVKRFDK